MFELKINATTETSQMSAALARETCEAALPHFAEVFQRLSVPFTDGLALSDDGMTLECGDGFVTLDPIYYHKPKISGFRQVPAWVLTTWTAIPGSFNPRNGGTPPDVAEKEIGVFTDVFSIARELWGMDIEDRVAGVQEAMEYEKIEALEDMTGEEPERLECPHGREVHECQACMVASDLAYDAMREQRAMGRF